MSELSSYRIKRSSFKITEKAMSAKHSDIMPQGEDEIEPRNPARSNRVHHIILNTSSEIPEIQNYDEASENPKAKYLPNNYPLELWCHVYTDGSDKDATRNRGSGVYIKYPDTKSLSQSFAVGKLVSKFRAELKAIRESTNILIERSTTFYRPRSPLLRSREIDAIQSAFTCAASSDPA